MKIVVTGDREWTSLETIAAAFTWLLTTRNIAASEVVVVEGEARGADLGCRVVAEGMGMKVIPMPAEWKKYGRAAGPIRNQQMLDQHLDITLCLAFHDDLEHSKGTKDMTKRCKRSAVPVWHFQSHSISPVLL